MDQRMRDQPTLKPDPRLFPWKTRAWQVSTGRRLWLSVPTQLVNLHPTCREAPALIPHIFIYHNICTTLYHTVPQYTTTYHTYTKIYHNIPHYVYHNIPHTIFALTLCLWLFPGPPNKAICPLVGEKGCVVRKLVDNLKEMFISGLYRIYQINLDITIISLNI